MLCLLYNVHLQFDRCTGLCTPGLPSLGTRATTAEETAESPLSVHARYVGRAQGELTFLADRMAEFEVQARRQVSPVLGVHATSRDHLLMTFGGFALMARDLFLAGNSGLAHGQLLKTFNAACNGQVLMHACMWVAWW